MREREDKGREERHEANRKVCVQLDLSGAVDEHVVLLVILAERIREPIEMLREVPARVRSEHSLCTS